MSLKGTGTKRDVFHSYIGADFGFEVPGKVQMYCESRPTDKDS